MKSKGEGGIKPFFGVDRPYTEDIHEPGGRFEGSLGVTGRVHIQATTEDLG